MTFSHKSLNLRLNLIVVSTQSLIDFAINSTQVISGIRAGQVSVQNKAQWVLPDSNNRRKITKPSCIYLCISEYFLYVHM